MNPVFTGAAGSATALSAPSAVAMNGEGDLFIADFNLHEIIVVPTKTGIAPYVLNTGSVQLQHPISLALDELGDLYIGDAGADGDDATSAAPGFVVEVPYNASAFQVPINGVSIVFRYCSPVSEPKSTTPRLVVLRTHPPWFQGPSTRNTS